MMTQKERFFALLHNEPVDGFVNQYQFIGPMGPAGETGFMFGNPLSAIDAHPMGQTTVSKWGITYDWPMGEPGAVPLTDPEHLVIKDIEEWQKYLKAPDLHTNDSDWDQCREAMKEAASKGKLITFFSAPGTFEYLHSFLTFEDSLMNLLAYEDEMHELIDFISDWRCDYWEEAFKHVPGIEAAFAHDDWGSKHSTFMAPDTFREFFVPGYKKLYGIAKDHGCVVIHHSDSYCETLLDDFFEIGIDVWQGSLPSNDICAIQKRLNDENREFLLMGGMDSAVFDRDDSTEEEVREHVRATLAKYAPGGHWIPCVNDGLPWIIHNDHYPWITTEIDNEEPKYFPR